MTYGSTQVIAMMHAAYPFVSEAQLGDRLRFWSRSRFLEPVQRNVGIGRSTAWTVNEAKRAVLMQALVTIGMLPHAAHHLILQIPPEASTVNLHPLNGVTVTLDLRDIFGRCGFSA